LFLLRVNSIAEKTDVAKKNKGFPLKRRPQIRSPQTPLIDYLTAGYNLLGSAIRTTMLSFKRTKSDLQ
jgi:hypothetical protein